MKKLSILIWFFCILTCQGYFVFNLDFDDLAVDMEFQAPVGMISKYAYIRDASGIQGMSGNVLMFEGYHGAGGGIRFDADLVSDSLISISWDFAILSYGDGQIKDVIFNMFGDAANNNFNMISADFGGTTLSLRDGFAYPQQRDTITTFLLDTTYHFEYRLNQVEDTYELLMNGQALLSGSAAGYTPAMLGFGGSQFSTPTFAIDNFQWTYTATAIPEPGVMGLLAAGAGALAWRRRREK